LAFYLAKKTVSKYGEAYGSMAFRRTAAAFAWAGRISEGIERIVKTNPKLYRQIHELAGRNEKGLALGLWTLAQEHPEFKAVMEGTATEEEGQE